MSLYAWRLAVGRYDVRPEINCERFPCARRGRRKTADASSISEVGVHCARLVFGTHKQAFDFGTCRSMAVRASYPIAISRVQRFRELSHHTASRRAEFRDASASTSRRRRWRITSLPSKDLDDLRQVHWSATLNLDASRGNAVARGLVPWRREGAPWDRHS